VYSEAWTHVIASAKSGLYLDVNGDASWAGAHLITWYWNDTDGEFFAYWQL